MFEFEYPYILILIPFILMCLFFCKEKQLAIYFPQHNFFNTSAQNSQIIANILKFLITSNLTIALASPIKNDEVIVENSQGYEISLIVDASGSMKQLRKFDVVKEIVIDFINQRQGDKLALSIFADFAYTVVPLTYDKKSVAKLWESIEVGIAGVQQTALYEALFLSSKLFDNSKAKEKIAILLTDGVDNANNVPLDMAIDSAVDNDIKVYTIGIGGTGDFNPSVLEKIAKATGGKHFSATNSNAIKKIYNQINNLEKSEIDIDKYYKKTYFFVYPLGLALLLSIIYFWRKNKWNLNK